MISPSPPSPPSQKTESAPSCGPHTSRELLLAPWVVPTTSSAACEDHPQLNNCSERQLDCMVEMINESIKKTNLTLAAFSGRIDKIEKEQIELQNDVEMLRSTFTDFKVSCFVPDRFERRLEKLTRKIHVLSGQKEEATASMLLGVDKHLDELHGKIDRNFGDENEQKETTTESKAKKLAWECKAYLQEDEENKNTKATKATTATFSSEPKKHSKEQPGKLSLENNAFWAELKERRKKAMSLVPSGSWDDASPEELAREIIEVLEEGKKAKTSSSSVGLEVEKYLKETAARISMQLEKKMEATDSRASTSSVSEVDKHQGKQTAETDMGLETKQAKINATSSSLMSALEEEMHFEKLMRERGLFSETKQTEAPTQSSSSPSEWDKHLDKLTRECDRILRMESDRKARTSSRRTKGGKD